MKKLTAEQLVDKIIKELDEAGFTPDQMLEVIRMAKEKYNSMKAKETLIHK